MPTLLHPENTDAFKSRSEPAFHSVLLHQVRTSHDETGNGQNRRGKMKDRYISIPQRFVAEIVGQQTSANTTIILSGRMSKYRPQSSIIEFAPPFAERRATNKTEPTPEIQVTQKTIYPKT